MNPFKLLLLALFAPRFFADMPPPTPGRYWAEASSASPWYHWVRFSKEVTGRRRAYLVARWAAFKLDWFGNVSSECAIVWRVRSAK